MCGWVCVGGGGVSKGGAFVNAAAWTEIVLCVNVLLILASSDINCLAILAKPSMCCHVVYMHQGSNKRTCILHGCQ